MLKTQIRSLDKKLNKTLDNPFINASGCYCRTKEDLDQLITSSYCSSIISKTCTPLSRDGNPEPRYHQSDTLSINSMGLPNLGLGSYLEYFNTCESTQGIKIISLGGLTLEDNMAMFESIVSKHYMNLVNIDAVEINLSCPNLVGHGQLGYNFNNMNVYLLKILNIVSRKEIELKRRCGLLIGLKLPPYFDMNQFEKVANIIKDQLRYGRRIDFLTCINSIGNGLVIDTDSEKVVIKPKGGFGGIGGSVVKPTALANVRKFHELLGDKLFIIGCGGITNGEDAFHHLLAGANMLSIGTQLMKEGPEVFKRIGLELEDIMKKKGYKNVDDIIGKLKTIQ
jgi:dihydroorotate dehydrogenase (fumarate)